MTPELNNSLQWKLPSKPRAKKSTPKTDQCQVNAECHFDYSVVVHQEYGYSGQMINKEYLQVEENPHIFDPTATSYFTTILTSAFETNTT